MPTEKKTRPKTSRKQKPVVQLTYKGLCGWLSLYFLVVVWIFILGVMVGRGMAPVSFDIDKLEKELEVLRQTVFEKQHEEMKHDAQFLVEENDLEFYDALKKNKNEFHIDLEKKPRKDSNADKTKTALNNKTSLKSKSKAVFQTDKKPQKKAEQVKAKTNPPKERQSQNDKQGKYTIQYAATTDKTAADRLVDKLKKKGFAAYKVAATNSSKNRLYRIRVGQFKNTRKARLVLNKLKKMKKDVIVIAK